MSDLAVVEARGDLAILAEYELRGIISNVGFQCDDPDLPFEHLALILRACGEMKRRTSWIVGDVILWGEAAVGEAIYQAVEETGLSPGHLANLVSVCKRVAIKRRRSRLSFSHHECVASLEPAEQTLWLEHAEERGWSREELRDALREAGAVKPRPPGPRWSGVLGPAQEALPAGPATPPAARPLAEVEVLAPPAEPGVAAVVRIRPLPEVHAAARRLLEDADDLGVDEGFMRVPLARLTELAAALAQEA